MTIETILTHAHAVLDIRPIHITHTPPDWDQRDKHSPYNADTYATNLAWNSIDPDRQIEPDTWRDHAACRGLDTRLFFPEPGDSATEAKRVCRACPVAAECLDYANVHYEHGVWGGLTNSERRRLNLQLVPTPARPIRHGTQSGYQIHRRRGEQPCPACLEAMRADSRQRAAAQRAQQQNATERAPVVPQDRRNPPTGTPTTPPTGDAKT